MFLFVDLFSKINSLDTDQICIFFGNTLIMPSSLDTDQICKDCEHATKVVKRETLTLTKPTEDFI